MQPIKIHQNIIDAIITCIKAVVEDEKVADKEIFHFFKQNKQFGSRDRKQIAESVYDIIRWKIKYTYLLEQFDTTLTHYKHLILVSLLNRNYEISNPEIFDFSVNRIKELSSSIQQEISIPTIEQSYPKDFYDFCLKHIGESWHQLAQALNKKANVYLRVNTLKTTRAKFIVHLEKEEILYSTENCATLANENGIEILSKNYLKNSIYYQQGLFEFQDIGSQAIGDFIFDSLPKNQQTQHVSIADVCAGAGGKTLQLSALLNNKGKIYACDYQASRIKNLEYRAQQAGCTNIEIIDFKNAHQLKDLSLVFIDAPCSGSGTFKRQADLKYKISEEKINTYTSIQQQLLETYKNCITKNGKIIYATCSILPQENEHQIQAFLQKNKHFKLENSISILPTKYNSDGFFMASLVRV